MYCTFEKELGTKPVMKGSLYVLSVIGIECAKWSLYVMSIASSRLLSFSQVVPRMSPLYFLHIVCLHLSHYKADIPTI
jgi:hypothetical protein